MQILRSKWFILSILALTWGSSFILIKKSLEVFTPYQIGSIRVVVSGLLFMGIGIPAIRKMDRKTIKWMVIAGALGNFIPMFLFPMAQLKVSSSMAGILDTLVPVFVLILGFSFFKMQSKAIQWIGAIIGFIGAAILMYFSEDPSGSSDVGYSLLIVLATVCYAASALIVNQKLHHISSFKLSASVFTVWMFPSAIILFFSGFFCEFKGSSSQLEGLGYLGILSVVGTALAIMLYFQLIKTTSAVFASMVTYLLPIVAVFWGIMAGESFNLWYALGGILILSGIYMVQEKKVSEIVADIPADHS